MAYPTVSAPYGFQPINRIDGLPYAGAIQQLPVTSGQAIYYGDTVRVVAGGTISRSGATTTGTIVGVFVGCQYVNSMGQTVQAQYVPASGVTNPIAYVVVDPSAAFKVAVTTTGSTTTVTGANATIVGTNVAQTAWAAGSNATGDSISAIVLPANGAGDTTTLPFRVIAVVPETAYTSGGVVIYPEVIVKINNPQYTALTGTTYTA